MIGKTLLGGAALTALATLIAAAPVAAARPGVRAIVTDGTLRIEGRPVLGPDRPAPQSG